MTTHDLSSTIENYLGIIYVLERDGEPIIGARLAALLGVTPPTVTNTLKRMLRDGLLTSDEINGLHLSNDGMELARSVMRRHMLSEWMLSKMLSWSRLHDEAHQLEHGISNEVEKALLKELGDPELCPHGNPLPGNEAAVEKWVSLQKLKKGDRAVIRRVHELAEETPELLNFLEGHGIVLGKAVVVGDVLGFNQTVTIQVDGRDVTLGFATAKYLFVEPSAD
jgi:DtxR family transcriptional regulator, Mn-dependent transcriptional regulator